MYDLSPGPQGLEGLVFEDVLTFRLQEIFCSLSSQFRSTFCPVLFLQSFSAALASVVVIEWRWESDTTE